MHKKHVQKRFHVAHLWAVSEAGIAASAKLYYCDNVCQELHCKTHKAQCEGHKKIAPAELVQSGAECDMSGRTILFCKKKGNLPDLLFEMALKQTWTELSELSVLSATCLTTRGGRKSKLQEKQTLKSLYSLRIQGQSCNGANHNGKP